MNTQNILRFFGSKLDLKLDSSEFYDYELSKVDTDYDVDVLDLSTPISYSSLKIDTTLENFSCSRNTITLLEIDNTINEPDYIYSGLTATIDYEDFVNHISDNFIHTILNDNVFTYTGLTNETHYFVIQSYNQTKNYDINFGVSNEQELITGFTPDQVNVLKCTEKLDNTNNCCPLPNKLNNKPWAYQFKDINSTDCIDHIKRRTEKGWTLDFIFNRDGVSWSNGGVFYYLGTRGESNLYGYGDNNLSFQFTSDRRIKWVSHHYSGDCSNVSGYSESFYISSGQTPQLCTTGDTKDFNVTIVFDRYNRYIDCDLENEGGWNDLYGWRINDYTDSEISAVTSTQLAIYDITGETLNREWAKEREKRLGTLKIYLNGRPIYKIENWEEIVPSNRGVQPFVQSWGGGTGLMNNIHNGVSCFNIKSIKYYEEPLDFIHVRHNFLTRLNQYDFFICGEDCEDDIFDINDGHIIVEENSILLGDDDNHLIYNG